MDHGMDPLETQLKEAEKIIKDYEYHMVREPRWHEMEERRNGAAYQEYMGAKNFRAEISAIERTKKAVNMLLLIMLLGVYGMRVISKF